jgi:chitin disaccharide deacetylase
MTEQWRLTVMLIINADDWGGWKEATNAALACFKQRRITSVTAMVFMKDSKRAADLATTTGIEAGLHLNFTQDFTGENRWSLLSEYQSRIHRFLMVNKYSFVLYHPLLRREFRYVFEAQVEEFQRLYEKPPSHVDGHHHKHLCSNVLLDNLIPHGQKVRRNLTFYPSEKGLVNRSYRYFIDKCIGRRYCITDFLFSLAESLQGNSVARVVGLAKRASVELMTHPEVVIERDFLMSDAFLQMVGDHELGSYARL